jgi:hypothetical protein
MSRIALLSMNLWSLTATTGPLACGQRVFEALIVVFKWGGDTPPFFYKKYLVFLLRLYTIEIIWNHLQNSLEALPE